MRTITFNSSFNQVKRTLGWMGHFRDEWKADPDWRNLACQIVRGRASDREGETEMIRLWVKQYVEFRLDPAGVEYLQDPMILIDTRAGDCDDMATMAAVLLAALGHEVRPAGVVWAGDRTASHAVIVDDTTGLVCDPVSDVPCSMWPNPGYKVDRLVLGP